jgi:uncharacterized protein
MTITTDLPKPAFPFIRIKDTGEAVLAAQRCTECGATYADTSRLACSRCGARSESLEIFEPALEGSLYSAVIVRRGYPGVETPFISAVVDLDGGPVLKGTLREVPFEPSEIEAGRRVAVRFDNALGREDKHGNTYVAHYFVPA